MMEKRDNLSPPPPPPVVAKNESLTSPEMLPTQRKKKNKNKRRFSDEQVKLMESMFESDTKLEPKKKVQVARELGLQPRQVAIWFQNRRARWKSKQIEKDYRILKANYDNLTLRFESLKKEKDSLLIQLQKLNGLIKQSHDKSKDIKGLVENSTDGGSDNGDANCEYEVNPGCLEEGLHHRVVMDFNNHDDQSRYMGCTGQEEGPKCLNTDDYVDSSLAPSFGLLDQSCIVDSHWFNFWT